jgi:hypothetical protein
MSDFGIIYKAAALSAAIKVFETEENEDIELGARRVFDALYKIQPVKTGKWIPTSERMPEVMDEVLLLFEENRAVGFYSDGSWCIFTGNGFYTELAEDEDHPNAWMPLSVYGGKGNERKGERERKGMKELDYIRCMLSDRELLEQLAEEAAELGQAALKLIRATGVTRNPTPVDVGEASLALEEEFEDVVAVMSAFLCGYEGTGKLVGHSKKRSKWQRWANRVRKGEEKREHKMQQD